MSRYSKTVMWGSSFIGTHTPATGKILHIVANDGVEQVNKTTVPHWLSAALCGKVPASTTHGWVRDPHERIVRENLKHCADCLAKEASVKETK